MTRKEVYVQDLNDTKNLLQVTRLNSKFIKELLDIVKELYYTTTPLTTDTTTIAITNTNINIHNPLGLLLDPNGLLFSINAIDSNNALITYRASLPAGPQGPMGPQGPKGEGVLEPIIIPNEYVTWLDIENYLDSIGYPTPSTETWSYYVEVYFHNLGLRKKGYITRRFFGAYVYNFITDLLRIDHTTDFSYGYYYSTSNIGGNIDMDISANLQLIDLYSYNGIDSSIPTDVRLVSDQGKLQLQMEHDTNVLSIDDQFDTTLRTNLFRTTTVTGSVLPAGDISVSAHIIANVPTRSTMIQCIVEVRYGPAVSTNYQIEIQPYQLTGGGSSYEVTTEQASSAGFIIPKMNHNVTYYINETNQMEIIFSSEIPSGESANFDISREVTIIYI